jgi:hypothetical protein
MRSGAQHRYPRFLTLACLGFLTVADIKGNVGATPGFILYPLNFTLEPTS